MRSWLALIGLGLVVTFGLQREILGQDQVKVFNLEKLNTAANEEDPCATPDGLSLYFVRKGKRHYDIHRSARASTTATFGPGKPFIYDRDADVRSPHVHQNKLYFVTNEVPDKKFLNFKNFDIKWQMGTQAPLSVLGDINSKVDEMYPWVTASGKDFYFSRKTEDGWKLFVANGPVPGPIGKAKELGLPAGFHRATLTGSGLTMYLQGPLEDGKLGIFRSKRTKTTEAWPKPEPVTALNHPETTKGDMQPALSFDGTRLYFVSDRPGGKGGLDIWYVPTTMLK
ncbi:MAG: hypothetical protein EXR98_08390 [Gemmataceae bacterium]|nr:hypothetical protein [Gemmataceae bacterium]